MSRKDNKNNSNKELRKQAEGKLKSMTKKNKAVVPEILHELNVHKVELEMQNEELLATQVQLVNSIDEYSNLFTYAPIGYFTLNIEGEITNVNITGAKQLGVDKKELIGKHFSLFLSTKTCQDSFYKFRNTIIDTQQQQRIECEFNRKNNTVFFALLECNVVNDEQNNFKHFLVTIIDISEKRDLQHNLESALAKEKELGELKSRFITIASHEFRTPLSAIILSTELLEKYYDHDNKDVDKRKKHYDKIKNAVNRLKEILMDFLSLEEVETGKIKNSPVTFNLVNYITHLVEEVRTYNGTHQIKYEHIGKYHDIHLDKKLLNTCLTNLFINAFKYSPNGGIVEMISEQKKQGIISITIKDEGIGIPENEKEYIFQPFFRAKNAENIQGTGLGLEITQKLVQLMGGTISFKSEENVGTTFSITFQQ